MDYDLNSLFWDVEDLLELLVWPTIRIPGIILENQNLREVGGGIGIQRNFNDPFSPEVEPAEIALDLRPQDLRGLVEGKPPADVELVVPGRIDPSRQWFRVRGRKGVVTHGTFQTWHVSGQW